MTDTPATTTHLTDAPEIPDVLAGNGPAVPGTAAMVLWTSLTRRLVEKGLLTPEDVQGVIAAAHKELAHEQGSEPVLALLARLSMNAL